MGQPRSPKREGHRSGAGVGEALYGLVSGAVRRVPRDISLTSISTLATLERTGPRRVTDLASVEGVTQPSMTALVSALERCGLVERQTDATDKRVALVALTPAGWDHIQGRRRAGVEAMDHLIEKLAPEDAAALAAAAPALDRLRQLDDEQRDRAPGGSRRPVSGGWSNRSNRTGEPGRSAT
jgi:DNA-binding MarR family transcriptional regulator